MAPRVAYAIHRRRKQCAVFFDGDERFQPALPSGWERIAPERVRAAASGANGVGPRQILLAVCPPGYAPVFPEEGNWFYPSRPPPLPLRVRLAAAALLGAGLALAVAAVWLLASSR